MKSVAGFVASMATLASATQLPIIGGPLAESNGNPIKKMALPAMIGPDTPPSPARLRALRGGGRKAQDYYPGTMWRPYFMPVMHGHTPIHILYYGANWSPSQKALVERFTNDLGGSAWLNMDSTYYDEDGPTSINVSVGTVVSVPDYSYGQDLSDWDVAGLFSDAINSGALPLSANAIYAVLTDDTVKQHDDYGSSFGEVYCGWHSNGIWSEDDGSTFDLKWLWVGNALSMYPDNCISYSMRVTYGPPNGDAGIDGMLSVIAHEIAEAMTDPDLLGWRDAALWENADKCSWTWGDRYPATNGFGGIANVNMKGRDYQIQRNWVNAAPGENGPNPLYPEGGYCAQGLAFPTSTPHATATKTQRVSASRTATKAPASPSRTPAACPRPDATIRLNPNARTGTASALTLNDGVRVLARKASCADGALVNGYPGVLVTVQLDGLPLGGQLTIDTCNDGSTILDSVLYVGAGCPSTAAAFGCLASSDDACGGLSAVTVTATRRTYYALVQGWHAVQGYAVVTATYSLPSATSTATRSRAPARHSDDDNDVSNRH